MSISQPAMRDPGGAPRSRVIFGDARSMDHVADASVQLVVTSPPYWQLKDYGSDAQLGFAHSYEDYINQLNLVWSECHRALAPGCRLCVNIGDQFARSAYYGRYKVIPIRTEIIRFCETVGFDYMGAIIWQKVTTTNSSGGGAVMGSYPYPRNGVVKLDYEFILLFRRLGRPERIDGERKKASAMTLQEWNSYFSGHWNFPGQRQDLHLAAFPEELPRRLIKMFSFDGETVLDPFLGSGTTSVAAARLGRESVGYEVNPDYGSVIRERLGGSPTASKSSSRRRTGSTGARASMPCPTASATRCRCSARWTRASAPTDHASIRRAAATRRRCSVACRRFWRRTWCNSIPANGFTCWACAPSPAGACRPWPDFASSPGASESSCATTTPAPTSTAPLSSTSICATRPR